MTTASTTPNDTAGPAVSKLTLAIPITGYVTTQAILENVDGPVRVMLLASAGGRFAQIIGVGTTHPPISHWQDLGDAFVYLASYLKGYTLDVGRISTRCVGSHSELESLIVAAWCETFGVEPPTP